MQAGGQSKKWKEQRRPQQPIRDAMRVLDARSFEVVGRDHDKSRVFEFFHQGIFIDRCETVALYFDGNRRVAVLRKSGNDELDALHGRLLKAFYSIEVRT